MGTGAGAAELVLAVLREFAGPVVLDADALNVLAARRDELGRVFAERRARGHRPVTLTPHPGEMGRLHAASSADVQRDRLDAVRRLAAFDGVTAVLKGAATLVATGARLGFNTSGNPGMASPGMGDVLSGITAALAARIDDSFAAAALAVYVHGLAADLLAQRTGGAGFLAHEVADALPAAFALLGTG
jgi:NAD(P)H-hydrate epimerase